VGDRLDRRREVSALAKTEADARDDEPARAADQRVGRGSQAPDRDRHRVADLHALAIDEPTEQKQADGVGELERGVREAVLRVGPAELGVERPLDQRQDLTVDVVDGRGQEQQAADQPAITAHAVCERSGGRNG